MSDAARHQDAGRAYLAENAAKDGVTTRPSGLQYRVLQRGQGARPQPHDEVTVHSRGRAIEGAEFDSSYQRGQPATFPVRGVIAGWVEALQLMREGDRWELAIPPELAYGAAGAPPVIGPHQTLLFEVELLKVGGGRAVA